MGDVNRVPDADLDGLPTLRYEEFIQELARHIFADTHKSRGEPRADSPQEAAAVLLHDAISFISIHNSHANDPCLMTRPQLVAEFSRQLIYHPNFRLNLAISRSKGQGIIASALEIIAQAGT